MLNLILFGPPGSGKGTQSENILKKYQLIHLSTGDILRDQVKRATPLGIKAKELMDQGMLVPDEIVIGMISERVDTGIADKTNGFIFDGFPRTVAQAEALDKMLQSKNTTITVLVALKVSDEELTKRILERGKTSGRSDDTDVSIIQKRIEEYKNKTTPIADYYSKQSKYVAVEGEGTIDEIFASICEAVDGKLTNK